jgi:hypothetical protein
MLRLLRRIGLAFGLACAATGVASVVSAHRKFAAMVATDVRRLVARPRPAHAPVATEEMLAALPEPARRYLRYTGILGTPLVDTVRVRQAGHMRPSKDGIRLPITAVQWYTVDPPGFVWDASVPVAGLPVVRGRDGYLEGRGMMTIRIASLFPVVDASGPEMDQASLLRFLSEMPWFPSAFLRDRVSWEAVDDTTVRVAITDGDARASGTLEIDAEGRLVAFRSERHAMVGKGFELRPWTAPTYGYGEFEGLRLPVRGAAVWTLPDGSELPYIEMELTAVESDPSLPA